MAGGVAVAQALLDRAANAENGQRGLKFRT